jgi:hypothetical protein
MKGNEYKKETTSLCHWCDYYKSKCRKGHKCKKYKEEVKNKNFKKRSKDLDGY